MRLVSVWTELAVALWRPGHLEHGHRRRLPGTGFLVLPVLTQRCENNSS